MIHFDFFLHINFAIYLDINIVSQLYIVNNKIPQPQVIFMLFSFPWNLTFSSNRAPSEQTCIMDIYEYGTQTKRIMHHYNSI